VRGGSKTRGLLECIYSGRSPRARGKLRDPNVLIGEVGSIPACAGEASRRERDAAECRVDPRVRGGSASDADRPPRTVGRSPRARGKRAGEGESDRMNRSIPACAGEASASCGIAWSRRGATRVDPRVRGGSPPAHAAQQPRGGRSPRARGKRPGRIGFGYDRRSIPACAGEATRQPRRTRPLRVDPRVRGGSSSSSTTAEPSSGRSPRARGKQEIALARCGEHGSIPACAGEAPSRRACCAV